MICMNAGERIFVIGTKQEPIDFKPQMVLELTDKQYEPIKNYSEIKILEITKNNKQVINKNNKQATKDQTKIVEVANTEEEIGEEEIIEEIK